MAAKKKKRRTARKRRHSEVWNEPELVEAIEGERRRLGQRLLALRATRTREMVAEHALISDRALMRVENAEGNVTLGTLVALARFYRVRVADLFG